MRILLAIAAVACLAGCASTSSHVVVGTQRPAISPDDVKIYTHPPDKYEEVAIVDANSMKPFSSPGQQAKTDRVIRRLKEEAAALGANGLLLQGLDEQYAGSVGSGFGTATANGRSAFGTGFGMSAGIFNKTGKGMAIYVAPVPATK
jgi:hypothetical protein